ncbi:MIZ/SP-RING zinc finger [Carpediemonas membranifera]|uniref:MIZ/SP-RING zinc finger n=1 Tax=Carpediemonas membranifera TaxID=201153 RepID=A0A8J6E0P5_9EUKA|nr:MIZ/SP-RING zinc finger [Carpediemonas membranifera]|eukprot:KAG9395379.1 MIZ/SP-RING zinc finger [Carpediemonas membranifera]
MQALSAFALSHNQRDRDQFLRMLSEQSYVRTLTSRNLIMLVNCLIVLVRGVYRVKLRYTASQLATKAPRVTAVCWLARLFMREDATLLDQLPDSFIYDRTPLPAYVVGVDDINSRIAGTSVNMDDILFTRNRSFVPAATRAAKKKKTVTAEQVLSNPRLAEGRPAMMMATRVLTVARCDVGALSNAGQSMSVVLSLPEDIRRQILQRKYQKQHPTATFTPKTARQSTDSDSDSDLSDEEEEPWAGPAGKSVIVRLFQPLSAKFDPSLFKSDGITLSVAIGDQTISKLVVINENHQPYADITDALEHIIQSITVVDNHEKIGEIQLNIRPWAAPPRCAKAAYMANTQLLVEYGEMGSPKDVAKWIERNIPTVDADPSKLDNEDDDELEEVVTRFSLTDPLTFCRMTLPARGEHCVHTQCFDLQTFIQFGFQSKKWECPICSKPLTIQGCRVDSFVRTLLSTSGEDDEAIDVETHTGRILREGNSEEEIPDEPSQLTRPTPQADEDVDDIHFDDDDSVFRTPDNVFDLSDEDWDFLPVRTVPREELGLRGTGSPANPIEL